MSFSDSLAFEIASTQTELEQTQLKVKQLKKKLKTLSAFLEEINNSKPSEEIPNECD